MSAEIGGDVKKMFDSIEDIVAQADEVDEKYLQVRDAGKIWKSQNTKSKQNIGLSGTGNSVTD